MERKIGEIFEYNGEWYQCMGDKYCDECVFRDINCDDIHNIVGNCSARNRSDKKTVIFKKLEKVGEPCEFQKRAIQTYKLYTEPFISVDMDFINTYLNGSDTIDIIITQDIEDMGGNKTPLPKEDNSLTRVVYAYVNGKISDNELIKSIKEMSDEYPFEKNNLKPFSLEEAKQGKPVCTRDGRKTRIICFDAKDTQPIIGLYEKNIDGIVREYLCSYHTDGRIYDDQDTGYDLMMLPEKKEGWINVYKMKESTFGYITAYFDTEEKAKEDKEQLTGYVATVKINWEE